MIDKEVWVEKGRSFQVGEDWVKLLYGARCELEKGEGRRKALDKLSKELDDRLDAEAEEFEE